MLDSSLLVDLRGAQIDRDRGVARYSQALVLALVRERPELDIACLVDPDGDPPLMLPEIAAHCRILDGPGAIDALTSRVTHYLQTWLFDRGKGVRDLFPAGLSAHRPRLGAVVYDMIPWILDDLYLRDSAARRGYLRVLPALRSLDRLFTISESVRHDVVAIGGADPSRVVTIYGGLDLDRWPALAAARATPAVRSGAERIDATRLVLPGSDSGPRLEVRRPYWLCVGGDDPRKNLDRLMQGFALLGRDGERRPCLVVACSLAPGRAAELNGRARALGLEPGIDIVFTGFVPDETLGRLFESCTATIFPSLYEGLGLPVLESYAFGKPVLASDVSSLREIVPESCRFDPYDPVAIAEAVRRFAADDRLAQDSLAFAPKALAMCDWANAARTVAGWVDGGAAAPGATQRERPLWVVSSLPPDRSGVAEFTQRSLCAPEAPVAFLAPGRTSAGIEAARRSIARARLDLPDVAMPVDVLPLSALEAVRGARPRDPVLYVLGNSEHHLETLEHLLEHGAQPLDAVHLHDVFIGGLLQLFAGGPDGLDVLLAESYPSALIEAQRLAGTAALGGPGTAAGPRLLVDRGGVRRFFVNSRAAADHLRRDLGDRAAGVRIDVLFLPVLPPLRVRTDVRPSDRLRLAHFGIIGPSKQPAVLLAACDILAARRPIDLLLAGYGVTESGPEHGFARDYVTFLDAPSDAALQDAMAPVDVAVQLRYPDRGESSGVVNQLIALGRPVVCTRTGSFAELDGVVHLVPPNADPADLADTIERAAVAGPPAAAAEYVAAHSPRAFERRVRDLLGLESAP